MRETSKEVHGYYIRLFTRDKVGTRAVGYDIEIVKQIDGNTLYRITEDHQKPFFSLYFPGDKEKPASSFERETIREIEDFLQELS